MYPYLLVFGKQISTYSLCMILGVLLASTFSIFHGKRRGLIAEDFLIVAACALGLGLIGGGVLFVVVTYTPQQIFAYTCAGDFRFLGSGIVFYGGLIGGILGALLGIRIAGCRFAAAERAIVPFIPLGHAVGRIGCVMAGCCHGCMYDGPFALYYPNSVLGLSPTEGYFPVQIVEALINIGICVILLRMENKMRREFDLLLLYLGLYSVCRFFLEMFRGDEIRGGWHMLSTSQIISIMLLCISVAGLCWKHKE